MAERSAGNPGKTKTLSGEATKESFFFFYPIPGNSTGINSRERIFYNGVNYGTSEDNWNCKIQNSNCGPGVGKLS